MRYLGSQLRDQLKNLPQDIKEVISSELVSQKLDAIEKRFQVPEGTMFIIADEMNYVLVGLEPVDMFEQNLKQVTNLSAEVVSGIAAEIHQEIFSSIKDSLLKVYTKTPHNQPAQSEEVPNPTPMDHTQQKSPSIIDQRLQQPVKAPTAVLAGTKQAEAVEKKEAFSADPYREPVN